MFGFLFQIGCVVSFVLRYHWQDYDNLPFVAFLILCVEIYKTFSCSSLDIHISRPIAVIAITCLVRGSVDVYSISIGYLAYWCLWTLRNMVFCLLDKIMK